MGIALPSVVNLHYVNPEVFVYEVRAFGCDYLDFCHPWGKAGLSRAGLSLTFSPARTNSRVAGSARPGGVPCSCQDHAMIVSGSEMENMGCPETLVQRSRPPFSPRQISCQATFGGFSCPMICALGWAQPSVSGNDDRGVSSSFVHEPLQAGWGKGRFPTLLKSLSLMRNCGPRVKFNHHCPG